MKRLHLSLLVALAVSSLCALTFGTSVAAQSAPNTSLEQIAVVPRAVLLAQTSPAAEPLETPILEPAPVQPEPQYQPVPRWQDLFTPGVWLAIFGVLSSVLTYPFTGLLKAIFKTEGITTLGVNAGLNTFFAGLLPWVAGVYPPTFNALIYVVLATGIGMFMDKLQHATAKQAARGSGL
jgi:hypothetical protein